MSDPVQRPRFFEGQVLAAEDLTAGLDYTRAQLARHNRLAHRAGIVSGLGLIGTPRSSGDVHWVDVSVSPGMAIDGTGREIVLPDAQLLDERAFERRRVAVGDPEAWYPVVIAGTDLGVVPPPSTRKCTPARANRTVEGWQIDFGAPGFEVDLDKQKAPDVEDGAGGEPGTPRWWILLGFVKWDATLHRFTAVADESRGIARRWIGVRADEVEGRGGSILVRTRAASATPMSAAAFVEGKQGAALELGTAGARELTPRMTIDCEGEIASFAGQISLRAGALGVPGVPVAAIARTGEGGTLTFGVQNSTGQLDKLLAVDEHGNLTIAGRFSGDVATRSFQTVKIASGVAWDGMVLPLPEGVTQAQLDRGEVRLHVQVSPRAVGTRPWDADPSISDWIGSTGELWVDDDRRVHCRVHWLGFPPNNTRITEQLAGSCNFTVTAVSLPPS
jgi:hypothetical protein